MTDPLPTPPPDLEKNLSDLRRQSFSVVALLALGICALWFVLGALRHYIQPHPLGFWISFVALLVSALVGLLLRGRWLFAAANVLVWGVLATVCCLAVTYPGAVMTTLLVLPVILAGTLLGGTGLGWVAGTAVILSIGLGAWGVGVPLPPVGNAAALSASDVILRMISGEFLLPLMVVVLTALAAAVSMHGLSLAVVWVWQGYERALHNEGLARNNQADLKRVLKSLENARYQLERTNYKLTLARNGAEEARRLKQQFVQTISHELRTPLNLIVGFTELMTGSPEQYGGALPMAYGRDLSIVYRNASHLQNLVNDVLDLARIESAHLSILPERTDPAALVREAVETIRSLVEAEGLALYAEIEPGLPTLWIDPTRIRQVLFNLLSNAARFTEQGGITVRVTRDDTPSGAAVLFAVADTGPGIAPEDMERIFREFQQLDGSTRRRHGGVGLGLVICQRFVRLHGGSIWAESDMGRGSTFYVRLPVMEATHAAEPVIDYADPHRIPAGGNGNAIRGGSSGAAALTELPFVANGTMTAAAGRDEPVLLVVTTSPLAIELLSRYITGAHTVIASDLAQAQRLVRQVMPQAIVFDEALVAQMAHGVDAGHGGGGRIDLAALGEAWGLRRTPLLICPLPERDPLRKRLPVDGYLLKPISQRRIWEMLLSMGDHIDTILVIDGEQDFVLLLSRMLEGNPVRSYSVIGATSGAEGLAMLRHHHPQLILMDMDLPDMQGEALISQLRAEPAGRDLPIVVASAHEELDPQEMLAGSIVLARPHGFALNEVVQWIQHTLDSVMHLSHQK